MAQDREEIKRRYLNDLNKYEVEVIPASEEFLLEVTERPELVGPYSRVSTMQGSQVESFETQKAYYTKYIADHPNWTMVDMYADEGISATSVKKRKDFLRLIKDCTEKKVTLILTKTVTRFARNAEDCIHTCRMLKALDPPVGVLFEADGIHTLSQNSELHLNLLAVLAQSESETKSISIKWALRKRFAQGIPVVADLYGYDRDGRILTINEAEAEVVRLIYEMYVSGKPVSHIIRELKFRNIPSPSGKAMWNPSTIMYILTNERYAGNVIMQKTLVADVFSHKVLKNKGQLPKYSIRNYHPAVIPEDVWLSAQRGIFLNWDAFLDSTRAIDTEAGVMYPVKLNDPNKRKEL